MTDKDKLLFFLSYCKCTRDPVTRENGLRLREKLIYTDIGKYFFKNRVTRQWNKLPANVTNGETREST